MDMAYTDANFEFLEHLDDDILPSKPAEWSEEDKDKVAQYLHDMDGGMLWSKATEITRDILDMLRPSWKPSDGLKMPKWRKAKKGTALPGDSVVRSPGEDPRLGKVAVRDCEYITVNELNSLPVED